MKLRSLPLIFLLVPLVSGTYYILTGNNYDFSGAGDWKNYQLDTFDVNSTVAGKMYMLGNGGNDAAYIQNILVSGLRYKVILKARLNAGASTTIRIGSSFNTDGKYFTITPTGTEQTFTGFFTSNDTAFNIGLSTTQGGFNGVAFEIDDVFIQKI